MASVRTTLLARKGARGKRPILIDFTVIVFTVGRRQGSKIQSPLDTDFSLVYGTKSAYSPQASSDLFFLSFF